MLNGECKGCEFESEECCELVKENVRDVDKCPRDEE